MGQGYWSKQYHQDVAGEGQAQQGGAVAGATSGDPSRPTKPDVAPPPAPPVFHKPKMYANYLAPEQNDIQNNFSTSNQYEARFGVRQHF